MGFMNEFLEHHWGPMTTFLQSVANPESSVHMATYDGYVDLALELATLHLLLCDIFSSLDQVPPPPCVCPHVGPVTPASFLSPCAEPGSRCHVCVTHPRATRRPRNVPVLSWQATQEELEPLPTILNAIREGTPVPVSVRLSSTTERRYRGVGRGHTRGASRVTPGAFWGGSAPG